mmetsp:Transcript_94998/g.168708  ORF Transcript_94998/g.168708 Transcript_94998/m.168708 type:complete len:239 (+) Transcript_94998:2530-3246(+)
MFGHWIRDTEAGVKIIVHIRRIEANCLHVCCQQQGFVNVLKCLAPWVAHCGHQWKHSFIDKLCRRSHGQRSHGLLHQASLCSWHVECHWRTYAPEAARAVSSSHESHHHRCVASLDAGEFSIHAWCLKGSKDAINGPVDCVDIVKDFCHAPRATKVCIEQTQRGQRRRARRVIARLVPTQAVVIKFLMLQDTVFDSFQLLYLALREEVVTFLGDKQCHHHVAALSQIWILVLVTWTRF